MRLSTACPVLWTDFATAQWSGFIVPGVYEAEESGNETKISAGNVNYYAAICTDWWWVEILKGGRPFVLYIWGILLHIHV